MGIILELQNLTKLYSGVIALDNVSIDFRQGEVHAIAGENGAGKSTLIKIVAGVIEPTVGEIFVNGKRFSFLTPVISRGNGIAVVYQEFALVPYLSVAENIFLGEFIKKGLIINRRSMEAQSAELFERLNIKIDPKAKVADLTTGYQQLVEIAKAISKKSSILIMDEPSAPLTSKEVDAMFVMIGTLKSQGVTVIYISHRLEEIFNIADRVSVLRDGKYIITKTTAETSKDELIRYMVGRTLKETYQKESYATDDVILSLRNVSGNGVKDISFDVKRGEIFGLGGLVGAGRTELVQMLFGAAKIQEGEIHFEGKRIHPRSQKQAVKLGISLVPENRKEQGVILSQNVIRNITLTQIGKLAKFGLVNRRREKQQTEDTIKRFNIRTPSIYQYIKNLSGGNQQKVILGKWINTQPKILIMDEPTRGIDVGAKQEIYRIMSDMAKAGITIIMISSEMEELIGMSDRIAILCKGRMSGLLSKEDFSQEQILKIAAGDWSNENENDN